MLLELARAGEMVGCNFEREIVQGWQCPGKGIHSPKHGSASQVFGFCLRGRPAWLLCREGGHPPLLAQGEARWYPCSRRCWRSLSVLLAFPSCGLSWGCLFKNQGYENVARQFVRIFGGYFYLFLICSPVTRWKFFVFFCIFFVTKVHELRGSCIFSFLASISTILLTRGQKSNAWNMCVR